ncbi:unnamed protein product, partial [Didymodactylos carnosus]
MVQSPCTDFSVYLQTTIGQRSDIVNLESTDHFTVAFQSSAYYALSLYSAPVLSWSIACTINVLLRPDGTINTSPTANIVSYINIPLNIFYTFQIPVADEDDDDVRCRFSTSTGGVDECGHVCYPAALPTGTVLYPNCTLVIKGKNLYDYYAVAIQVEDYLDSTSTTAFSSVPVQFLVYVIQEPSCPSPTVFSSFTTDACISVQVGQTLVIPLFAESYCSTADITDIGTLSFPIVLKGSFIQLNSTVWTVNLTYTPTASEIGLQILCAIAIDTAYTQSSQYCLTFIIGDTNSLYCQADTTSTLTTSTSTSTETTTSTSTTSTSTTSTSTTLTSTTSTSPIPQGYRKSSTDSVNLALLLGLLLPLLALLALCCCGLYCLFKYCWLRRLRHKNEEDNRLYRSQYISNKRAHSIDSLASGSLSPFESNSTVSTSLWTSALTYPSTPNWNYSGQSKPTRDSIPLTPHHQSTHLPNAPYNSSILRRAFSQQQPRLSNAEAPTSILERAHSQQQKRLSN